ncbi:tripartite tricarboxylate transporter permease [uncultured Aliiroseovarius sp.]|uniref:tripartite tricarboxylate transporter permease n=1 Tax=uncultured Aliiroseovarius sp. TaxID=1658783 RepID=UPI002598FDFC|nr:tripartite tricarboxylate transporter permease [uncultured Aliiroseovarius sp.]
MTDFLSGFSVALQPMNLFYCFLGVLLGNIVGVLPGIGAIAAISILLPITFYLDPTAAVIMLAGVYYGAEYGGSIASILLNLPGTASNAITTLDGYPMAKRGEAGLALLTAQISSLCGGTIGILAMVLLSPLIVKFSLSFGPAEYFATLLLGLIAGAVAIGGSPLRGIAMVFVGMLLGTIGLDLNSGAARFDMGFPNLLDGLSIVAVAMGLFGIPEVIANLRQHQDDTKPIAISARSMFAAFRQLKSIGFSVLRGASVGSTLGPLPGAGPTIASFLAYSLERSVGGRREEFGTGRINGVAAPEAANNAAAQTAFIPTMTLGIPGTPTMAIILGALMIHGIAPGPQLVVDHPDLFWGLIASFWIGNLLLVIFNIPLIGIWARLVAVPRRYLFPIIIALICTGVFGVANSTFDIWAVLTMGLIGSVLRFYGFSPAPLLIGFVLGPMLEEHLRRALMISDGNFGYLFSSPTAIGIHIVTAVTVAVPLLGIGLRNVRGLKTGQTY